MLNEIERAIEDYEEDPRLETHDRLCKCLMAKNYISGTNNYEYNGHSYAVNTVRPHPILVREKIDD